MNANARQAREEDEARRKKEHPRASRSSCRRAQTAGRLELCPDEKCVIAMVNDAGERRKARKRAQLRHRIGVHGRHQRRTNVGDAQTQQRVAILDVVTGEVKWVDAGLGTIGKCSFQAPVWNEAGHEGGADRARRPTTRIAGFSRWTRPRERRAVLFTEHDDAWLNGSGHPGAQTLGWLKNGDEIYFQSETRRLLASVSSRLRRRRSEAVDLRQVRSERRRTVARRHRSSTSPPAKWVRASAIFIR